MNGGGELMVVENGRKVSFDYELTVDGQMVDSSKERGPFQYMHGEAAIIPGLARQMSGLGVGDEKNIAVSPDEAYGAVNPKAFREIPKTQLPENLEPAVDMMLQMQDPQGHPIPVRISEVKESSLVLDLNHPLAGKTLIFQVKIVAIQ